MSKRHRHHDCCCYPVRNNCGCGCGFGGNFGFGGGCGCNELIWILLLLGRC